MNHDGQVSSDELDAVLRKKARKVFGWRQETRSDRDPLWGPETAFAEMRSQATFDRTSFP